MSLFSNTHIYKVIKTISILLIVIFSWYFSYYSYFFYDVIIWKTTQWTYSTYNLWKEVLINTAETKENIIWSIKNLYLNVKDKEKADQIQIENEIKKEIDKQEEILRKQEQEKTKRILSLIPYFLSFLTFLVTVKFLLNLLMNLITVNLELIKWIKK